MSENCLLQGVRLNYKKDSVKYRDLQVDNDYQSKRMALRSLMNICMMREPDEEIIKVQDELPMIL